MVKVKSNRDSINLGVLVPKGSLRYFKKKGDVLDLTKEEAENFTVESQLESGILSLVGKGAKADKKADAKAAKDAANKTAFSNEAPAEDSEEADEKAEGSDDPKQE